MGCPSIQSLIHHCTQRAEALLCRRGALGTQFHLVRQYDLPSYGIKEIWRLIMRSVISVMEGTRISKISNDIGVCHVMENRLFEVTCHRPFHWNFFRHNSFFL